MRIALVAGAKPKLVGFAVLLMALALTLTMSRSGMLGLLAALVISGWFVSRGGRPQVRDGRSWRAT